MREFERSAGRLTNMAFHARLVYTIFLVFTLTAIALTAWLADSMVGLDLSETAQYYAGEPHRNAGSDASSLPGAAEEGPSLDLPSDMEVVVPAAAPMSTRRLLEVTHFHLFSMPLYLLLLAHLYALSGARPAAKSAWIAAGTAGVIGHIAAPWVARQASGGASWLYGGSGLLLAVAFVWMSVVPLWEMWFDRARGRRAD